MADAALRRVVIAVTESSSIVRLWQAALACRVGATTDLLALFIADDRWHRAASLSFTHEISRIGGTLAVFTPERANRLHREAIRQARRNFDQLAAESRRRISFEVLTQTDTARVEQLAAEPRSALVGPEFILRSPIYDSFVQRRRRVVLVPGQGEQHESR
jgi:hypothetical protein